MRHLRGIDQHQCGAASGRRIGAADSQPILWSKLERFEVCSLHGFSRPKHRALIFGLAFADQSQADMRHLTQIGRSNGADQRHLGMKTGVQRSHQPLRHRRLRARPAKRQLVGSDQHQRSHCFAGQPWADGVGASQDRVSRKVQRSLRA